MSLYSHSLWRLRFQILWFGLGLAAWGATYVFIFPIMRDAMRDMNYPSEVLSAFGASGSDLSDPRLFFDVEFFSLAPSIAAVFAVIAGTGALAGEESAGTIEFLAALPLSRRRMFIQKGLAVVAGSVAIAAIISLGWLVTAPVADFGSDLSPMRLIGATFMILPFVTLIVAVAMLLGAVAPTRSNAAAWTGGLVIIAYLAVTIASITDRVQWLRYFSPYYYTDLPGMLEKGPQGWHQGVLWLLILLCAAAGLRAFEGREIGAGHWQWSAIATGSPVGSGRRDGETNMAASGTASAKSRGILRFTQRRNWWLFFVVLAVVGAAAGALGAATFHQFSAPASARTISASGRVDADSVRVLSPTTGTVHAVLAARGDEVRQGQVLGWMTSALDGSEQPIVAPLGGSLTDLSLVPGQSAPIGTPLGEVHRTDSLEVVLEVGENDLARIATGQPVDVTITALKLQLRTHVQSIASTPISEVGSSRTNPKYEVRCPLSGVDPRVAIGMRVNGKIEAID